MLDILPHEIKLVEYDVMWYLNLAYRKINAREGVSSEDTGNDRVSRL